jgi:hypothetical protein
MGNMLHGDGNGTTEIGKDVTDWSKEKGGVVRMERVLNS